MSALSFWAAGHGGWRRASRTARACNPRQYIRRYEQTLPAMWGLTGVIGISDQPRPACQARAIAAKLWVRTEQKKACGLATGCGGCFAGGAVGCSAHWRSSSCCQGTIAAQPCTRACQGFSLLGMCCSLTPQGHQSPSLMLLAQGRTSTEFAIARLLFAAQALKLCSTHRPSLVVISP